jgi:hypothetical protein
MIHLQIWPMGMINHIFKTHFSYLSLWKAMFAVFTVNRTCVALATWQWNAFLFPGIIINAHFQAIPSIIQQKRQGVHVRLLYSLYYRKKVDNDICIPWLQHSWVQGGVLFFNNCVWQYTCIVYQTFIGDTEKSKQAHFTLHGHSLTGNQGIMCIVRKLELKKYFSPWTSERV